MSFSVEYEEDMAAGKKFLRTIKCGCGDCRFKDTRVVECPEANSPKAAWLFVSNPKFSLIPMTQEEGDPGIELKEVTG